MKKEWVNWSGSLKFRPESIEKPGDEDEVQEVVQRALSQDKNVRIVGAGHSSVPLVETDQILVSQENMKGLVDYDKERMRVKLLAGTNIEEAGEILIKLRMSMHNTGDVDYQHLGGAFGTGTHGSGKNLQNLPGMLTGCKLLDGQGQKREFTLEDDPEMINALRVGLGALGFFTELTIQAKPAKKYSRREYCTDIFTCMDHLYELIDNNEMFDFYWYPRNDEVKLRVCNPLGEGMKDVDFARFEKQEEGWLYEILPKKRDLKFDEMEYAIPMESAKECFAEVRKRVRERHRQYVGWRVLFRTVAADDGLLSPFHKRDSVTIALLQNNVLEYEKYFTEMEPLLKSYDGRPHWGKKHYMKADELAPLYPEWERFMRIRKEMDPEGIFLNDYLKEILGL